MKVKDMIEALSKYDPDLVAIIDVSEGDGYWLGVERVKLGLISRDSDTLYYDADDAIEGEAEDWGGELEEVVSIRV